MDPDQDPKYTFRPIAEEPSALTMSPSHRPKLYNCWRRSEENWSSTGSRHSSRPGSSTASSSRPPSQPQTSQQQSSSVNVSAGLYCKSNNSSLSDVSVARNFQQLSVSSRRALFKTQKWSHSFEQQQMSPGKRRQVNKSLDLDSGYSGSLATDIVQSSIPTRVSTVHSPLESISDQVPILPSFPESFNPEVNLIPPDIETLDDFDDEIKMIVERAERRTTSEESDDGLLSFLEEHGIETSIGDNAGVDQCTSLPVQQPDLLCVRPEPVRTRNPLLCQKSSSSSGYETCISSVSDNAATTEHSADQDTQPLVPPRTKRGKKVQKSPLHPSDGNEFILPSSSTLDSNNANKMHLSDLISYPDPSAGMILSTSPMISPPSTGNTVNTQVDTRIFQFPPSNQVKQEDFMPCLQDGYSISPMAISPNMSTLNTPRGSITSMRSQQSPMDQNPPPPQSHHHHQSNPVDPDPIMSSYDAFEAAFVYPCSQNYPSPPGSPIVSSTTNFQPYDDYFTIPQAQETVPNITFANQSSVLTTYTSTPDPTESFVSSDTCPETPDSSVKEESADTVNSPDTGSYICLWQDCAEEFVTQKTLVEHINENHMDNKKGCEEFPCMWKDCSRKSKAFNAKYKLITHMRVHTKEKPYLCMHEGCNRAFARSENRKIHMRSHSGEKPFNCKYAQEFNCTKKFSNSSDRAKHEQTHKDPKPYKCEVLGCTKRYTDPSSLRKHVKSHSAEEQEQYRRTKDLANLAKRSTSPTARYSSWTPGPVTSLNHQGPAVILEEQHLLTSSSTLLQTGGTLMTMEDMSSSSPVAPGVPSPLLQHKSREQSQRNESYPHHPHHHALAHQQNSLDDLDNDTIPFDNVPVRYDGTDLYNEMNTEWPSN